MSGLALVLVLASSASALRISAQPPKVARASVRLAATALADKDIALALDDPKYAMDISSITAGSEKETYIGQGSGVNEGAGVGRLAGWAKGLVGRFLSWKNRPVYEGLWSIIEDDLLAMVQEHEPTLEQRRTWFSEPDTTPAAHTFATADGKCEGTVAGYKGGERDPGRGSTVCVSAA